MHEFNTDGAAISFSKTSDDFAQRLRSGPVKSGAGKELIDSLGGQAIKSRVQFGRFAGLLAQGIEIRCSVAKRAVGSNHVVKLFLKCRREGRCYTAASARRINAGRQ